MPYNIPPQHRDLFELVMLSVEVGLSWEELVAEVQKSRKYPTTHMADEAATFALRCLAGKNFNHEPSMRYVAQLSCPRLARLVVV